MSYVLCGTVSAGRRSDVDGLQSWQFPIWPFRFIRHQSQMEDWTIFFEVLLCSTLIAAQNNSQAHRVPGLIMIRIPGYSEHRLSGDHSLRAQYQTNMSCRPMQYNYHGRTGRSTALYEFIIQMILIAELNSRSALVPNVSGWILG